MPKAGEKPSKLDFLKNHGHCRKTPWEPVTLRSALRCPRQQYQTFLQSAVGRTFSQVQM